MGEALEVRLERTDTGATALRGTTHATEGGGGVGAVHLQLRLGGGWVRVKVSVPA